MKSAFLPCLIRALEPGPFCWLHGYGAQFGAEEATEIEVHHFGFKVGRPSHTLLKLLKMLGKLVIRLQKQNNKENVILNITSFIIRLEI